MILLIRLNVNTTSADVITSPLENFWFGFSLQVYSFGEVKEQLCAASGWGAFAPAGTFIRNW